MNDCDLVETMQLTQQSVGKFVALGGTFTTHQEEDNNTYRWPDLWVVPPEGVISEDETIQLPDHVEKVKPGSEITAVIGEDIHRASEEEAWDAISGFTVSNDVTASGDWPGWSDPDYGMITGVGYKIFPTFSPILSEVVPKHESEDFYYDLDVKVTVDGEKAVSGNTSQLAFSIPEMVAFASEIVELHENDVIALGDPGGASVFLDDAAEVTCTIESIGELTNPIERL
jgi:2-keto-4-pentenoate hydratase/2-oxohepta-3-ene-1,7-dioic acid hydratase in catechol pathway